MVWGSIINNVSRGYTSGTSANGMLIVGILDNSIISGNDLQEQGRLTVRGASGSYAVNITISNNVLITNPSRSISLSYLQGSQVFGNITYNNCLTGALNDIDISSSSNI